MMCCYRGLLGWQHHEHSPHYTNAHVRKELQQPSTEVLLRQARLRYVYWVLVHAPTILMQLLTAEDELRGDGWWALLRDDLRHLRAFFGDQFQALPEPSCDLQSWFNYIKFSKGRWYGFIRKYAVKAVWQETLEEELRQREIGHEEDLVKAGLLVGCPDGGDGQREGQARWFKCEQCDFKAVTRWQVNLHASRKHGAFSSLRRYMFANGVWPASATSMIG